MNLRKREVTGLLVRFEDGYYLSEHNNKVDFNHAAIFRSAGTAFNRADEFNESRSKSLGRKLNYQLELTTIRYCETHNFYSKNNPNAVKEDAQ